MEAKVDIRKLQILNDRIAQTLDALNQVRMSVHGIGQTTPTAGFGHPGIGLSHTTPGYGQVPYGQVPPWFAGSAFPQHAIAQGMLGSVYGQQQVPWQMGLSHTSPETLQGWGTTQGIGPYGVDPYFIQQRVMQTFPFAQWPLTPYV